MAGAGFLHSLAMWWTLLPCLVGASPDTAFPEWKARDSASTRVVAPVQPVRRRPDEAGWIVDREHPALGRDSTSTLEIGENPVSKVLLWPFDHAVRPGLKLALRPFHSAVDYGESSNVIDRGVMLVHPTGDENVWFYPVTTLDGTANSRWGLVYMDKNLFSRGWSFRASGAVTVEQDASGWVGGRTESITPLGLALRGSVSGGRSRAVDLRVPGAVGVGDATPTGAVSLSRFGWDLGVPGKGPVKGSTWEISYGSILRWTGLPTRQDQELPTSYRDSFAWFNKGDRGTSGTETDRTMAVSLGWSDQNLAGAPTSGGPVSARAWKTWADGGGDVVGMDVSATRCFLLGSQRYVYRKEDLRPYVDLDPGEIVRILDPTTLMERLTQRKILVVGFRFAHIWETDPSGAPASFFLFPSMGGDAPARAYGGGYLMDRTVAGGSVEYRWPIWKYLDGVAFTELAWASPGWWVETPRRLAPGVGGGLRARLDRLFLFRGYLAWGRAGTQYSLTTSSEF